MTTKYLTLFICSLLLLFSCEEKEDIFVENRLPLPELINPTNQPNELNNALTIFGIQNSGNIPTSVNSSEVSINIFVPSALITNDNFLFLPFTFTSTSELEGIYLQIVGAQSYWDAMIDPADLDDNSLAIAIGIPENILTGNFQVIYKVYDSDGNISEPRILDVAIIDSENRCGSGTGFPRVNGSDGITVRTYDMGDVAGIVEVYYYMYTQKDRMDIRYNDRWVASTSPVLLQNGQAPPFKECSVATPADGFVSLGGRFDIDYDPAVSRELSIYMSGCLQGGTQWYFDVVCPEGSGTNPPGNGICDQVSAQTTFSPTSDSYHYYPDEGEEIYTEICDVSDDNCTRANVFAAMLKQKNFIAPTSQRDPVTNCDITWVDAYMPGPDPVVSTIDHGQAQVTNYTLEDIPNPDFPLVNADHFLHPGKVVRTIIERDGKIGVITIGEGTGLNWFNLNVTFASAVWKSVDDDFKKYWDENN